MEREGWGVGGGGDKKPILSFFKAIPPNRLHFYLGDSLHRISSFFSYCLIREAILQKPLKVRFSNFELIFLRILFSLVATFFPLVLVICLSWYLHLKLSHEFLTLVSFTIWRYKLPDILKAKWSFKTFKKPIHLDWT